MDASYFDRLIGSVTQIARHSYYPGKEEAVELCLEEIEELRDSGQISVEQLATLRELLLGEENCCLLEGMIREREHPEETLEKDRIAILCQGVGSQAAFSAGVLQGLLEQEGDYGEIAALGGTSFGSLCALLAWDGLLRGGSRRAMDQLEGFWGDYAAASLIDTLLNYSAQMMLHLRSMVGLPGLGPPCIPALCQDQLRRMLERQVDFAQAHSLAARQEAPGLVVGSVGVHGTCEVFRGPELSAEAMLASATLPHLFPARRLEPGTHAAEPCSPRSPVRELANFKPSEIWLIQISKINRPRSLTLPGDLFDQVELIGDQLLELELRFIETINRLLERGVLIDGDFRHIEVHRIIMEHDLDDASKLDRSPGFIDGLMSYGRDRAKQFLEKRENRLSNRSSTALRR
jgi:NTE family protein